MQVMHPPEVWGITFYRGKVGQNSNCPSCGVLYGGQKSSEEGGQSHLQFETLGLLYPEVGFKIPKSIRKSGISTVFGAGRCGGSLKSWVLVY